MKLFIFLLALLYSSVSFAETEENPVITQFKKEAQKLGYKNWQINIAISIYTNTQEQADLKQFLEKTNLKGTPIAQTNCKTSYIMHVDEDINVFVPDRSEIVTIKGYAFNKHKHSNKKPEKKTVGFYKCNSQKLIEKPILFAKLN